MKCIVRALRPPRRSTSSSGHGSSSSLKDRIRRSFSSEDEPQRLSISTMLDECSVARSLSDIISEHEWVRLHLDEPFPVLARRYFSFNIPLTAPARSGGSRRTNVRNGRQISREISRKKYTMMEFTLSLTMKITIKVLDTRALLWSSMPNDAGAINNGTAPHFVGHFVAMWKSMLVVLGGESSNQCSLMEVHAFDLKTKTWLSRTPSGDVPLARVGHSVVQVENKLMVFGGEDASGRMLDEFYVLDLESLAWESPKTGGMKPAPRKYHAAGCHAGRYLWIFGGKSYATYYKDVFCLDLITMVWSKEKTKGSVPQIGRARHVGVMVGGNFYVVGGENRGQEMVDTLVLDVVRRQWSVVTMIECMSPLAHDGLSVVRLQRNDRDYLVAFGGHGTLLSNQVYVMLVTTSSRSIDTIHKRLSRSSSESSMRLSTKESPRTRFRSRESASPKGHFQLLDASTSSSSADLSSQPTTPSDYAQKQVLSASERNTPSVTSLAHDMEDIKKMVEDVVKSDGNVRVPMSPLGRRLKAGYAGETDEEFIVFEAATETNSKVKHVGLTPGGASGPTGDDLIRNNLVRVDQKGKSSRFPFCKLATDPVSPSSKRFDSSSVQDLDGSRSLTNSLQTGMSKRWTAPEADQGVGGTPPVNDHYLVTALQTVKELHRQVELLHKSKDEQDKDLETRFRNMEAMASQLEVTIQQQQITERKLQETIQLQKETQRKLQEVSQLQRSTEKRYQSVKQQKSDIENEYILCLQQKEELERHLKALAIHDD